MTTVLVVLVVAAVLFAAFLEGLRWICVNPEKWLEPSLRWVSKEDGQ